MKDRYAKIYDSYSVYTPAFDSLERINNQPLLSPVKMVGFIYKRDRVKYALDGKKAKDEQPENKEDLKNIKATYLIQNIDYAFKAWNLPWSKHLPFPEFCQFVLPYRYAHEELQSWRMVTFNKILKLIGPNLNKIDKTDPVQVYRLLDKLLKNKYSLIPDFEQIADCSRPLDLIRSLGAGSCVAQSGLAVLLCRSIGLPVANLVILKWGNRSKGHNINAILSKNGKWVDFSFCEGDDYKTDFKFKPVHIFMEYYTIDKSQQDISYSSASPLLESLNPVIFKNTTSKFINSGDTKITLYKGVTKKGLIYLAIYNNLKWVPIAASKVNGNVAFFNNFGANIVYLPVFIKNEELYPVSKPFYIDNNKVKHEISFNENFEKVRLTRKYFENTELEKSAQKIIGAKIQAGNNMEFSKSIDLLKIQQSFQYPVIKKIKPIKSKFLRLIYPTDDTLNTSLAGLKFYTTIADTLAPLEGKTISNLELKEIVSKNVFDDNPLSYLKIMKENGRIKKFYKENLVLNNTNTPFWIGKQFDKAETITAISYTQRNDDNAVYAGQSYELFYWDNQWISMGIKKAVVNSIQFNVPKGALLLLKNTKGGTENRIFLYQGNQIFY